jgi:hypothetical protein
MTQNIFQPLRFYHFVRRQLVSQSNTLLTSGAGVLGVLLFLSLATAYASPSTLPSFAGLYLAVFYLIGFLHTSRIFAELHKPQKSYAFLTLPVSTLEKLLGTWLISSLLYVLAYLFSVSIIFALSLWLAHALEAFPTLFESFTTKSIGVYLIAQSVFFLGAITFRNNVFFKTLLSVLVLLVGCLIAFLVIVRIVFNNGFDGEFDFVFNSFGGGGEEHLITNIACACFAPFMLLVSYFKLKERQV